MHESILPLNDTVHSATATVTNALGERVEFGNNLYANGRRLSDCLEKRTRRASNTLLI